MSNSAQTTLTASCLGLTPGGVVICHDPQNPLHETFANSESAALITLGGHLADPAADASTLYWKSLADHLIRALCQVPESSDSLAELPPPDPAQLASWTLNAPPMPGAEYLSPDVLLALWQRLTEWTCAQISQQKSIAIFLQKYAPAWSRVGRVTLHLAEQKNDPDFPFAFMASYASGLSQSGRLTQVPLGKALQEYSGAKNKAALLKLLTPLHAAGKACPAKSMSS